MGASNYFITSLAILLILNFVYYLAGGNIWQLSIGGLTGFIAMVTITTILGGFQILGSGLSSFSVKALFGIGTLLNLLFQINVGEIPVGLGLLNNVWNVFSKEDFLGIGAFITAVLGLTILLSGIMVMMGGSE